MGKVLLLITKSEISFKTFVLAIRYREMNPDQDDYQTSIKMI